MRTVQIFLGGGVKLLHGENEFLKGYRNDVIDPILSQLNSREYAKHFFVAKDFSDLTRNVVKVKHQDVYNNFIVHESQIALFIVDGKVGNITKHEIDIAVASTKKSSHPIVYVYGKNIEKDSEIIDYLNQEGIYFQHFFDNRDLAAKIKADLDIATKNIDRQRVYRIWRLILLLFLLCGSILLSLKTCVATNEKIIDNCTAQLYLMRYHDVNALTGTDVFNNELLSNFKYEDSVMTGNDISVFPVKGKDSITTITPPFFRLKLHNRHRNTIVFIEAKLEIDKYSIDNKVINEKIITFDDMPEVDVVNIDGKNTEYTLKQFRQNVAYGETDDRYFFALLADKNCSFRMRVRAKSQLGDYLYSNYIYVKYLK